MPPDSPPHPTDQTLRLQKAALILTWMAIGAGALWGLTRLWPVAVWLISTLSPFLIALVVAYIFNPIVNVVQKKFKLGRVGGILAVAAVIVLLMFVFFGFLVPVLYDQAVEIVQGVRAGIPQVLSWVRAAVGGVIGDQAAGEYQRKIRIWLDSLDTTLRDLARTTSPMASDIASGGVSALRAAAGGLGAVFSGVAGFVAAFTLILVISFYYLLEFDAIPRLVRRVLPGRIENRTMEILGKIDTALGGFLRGQLIVCTLIAVIASIGLAGIGMWRYAVFVGVLAGAANVIPYLGPAMGAAPALLWALLSPDHPTWISRLVHAAAVIALFGAIQTLDGLVLQPRIVGRNSNLHPLLVIGALVVGAQFGLGGMILAVPVACIGRVLFLELVWNRYAMKKECPET
ncbi:AI-2E family transporter [Candidatus Sumerlaeota bacterium]|nr:AI-2E family transporter [Candidatus Sumerlaeota bacterium]